MVMTKIMQTLWDESAELTDEGMSSDASVLSDSYTSGDVKDVTETIPFYNACMTLYAKICGSDFSQIFIFTPFLPFPFKS